VLFRSDYEAFVRLELSNGKIANASEFLPRAIKSGIIRDIDHQMLFKVIRLLRELDRQEIKPGIFWNMSHDTLTSKKAQYAIQNLLRANSSFCSQIHAEISQTTYQNLKSGGLRKLSTLREMGLPLSIDQCTDIDLINRLIKSGMFTHIKIPTTTLIGYDGNDIAFAGQEISHLASELDVKIIATHVEEEFQVMELIDQDILFGQGNLFSKPRPVKKDCANIPLVPTALA